VENLRKTCIRSYDIILEQILENRRRLQQENTLKVT